MPYLVTRFRAFNGLPHIVGFPSKIDMHWQARLNFTEDVYFSVMLGPWSLSFKLLTHLRIANVLMRVSSWW